MTNKDVWLKLFKENDIALATAIILCERCAPENLNDVKLNIKFIKEKNELVT